MMSGDVGTRLFSDSEAALHEEAIAIARCDDFGDPSYREALRTVLDAYDREARFHEAGRAAARANLVGLLATRLRSQKRLAEHARARAASAAIRRPVIVLGLVRTGSTALHHLLAQDPGIQVLEYWLAAHPQPRPPRATWADSAEFQESAAEIEAMYAFDPSLRRIHLMAADLAEECRHLLAQSFVDDSFEVNASVPSYVRWYEGGDHAGAYRRHRELLGLIGADEPDRRWLLKYPVHLKHLGSLLEVYPDACIVQTHRDPSQVLASYVELIAGFRAIFEHGIDRAAIAREQLEGWAAAAERAIAVRASSTTARFHDVFFRDFIADPWQTVRAIYDACDLSLSEEAEQRMRAWHGREAEEAPSRRPRQVDDADIPRAAVLDRFGAYMRHFDLRAE
jgi:hypothetical protein